MTANPVELVGGLATTSNVSKGDLISLVKGRMRLRFGSAAEVRDTNLTLQYGGIYVSSTNKDYHLDISDTTTPDDGDYCIVDRVGNRFIAQDGLSADFLVTLKSFTGVTPSATFAGAVDCTAGIVLALASGLHLTGEGYWYGVSGDVTMPDGLYLTDAKIKQLTPNDSARRTLKSSTAGPVTLRRVTVHRNGTGTEGSASSAAGIWFDGTSTGIVLDEVEVTGDGLGELIHLANSTGPRLTNLNLHDATYVAASDPGFESLRAIRLTSCTDVVDINPTIKNMLSNIAGVTSAYQTTGYTIGGCKGVSVHGGILENCGQLSDSSSDLASEDIWFYGTVYKNGYTYGQKFAHRHSSSGSIGCRAYRCGLAAVVVASSPGGETEPGSPRNVTISDFIAYDTGAGGNYSASNTVGFYVTGNTVPAVNTIFKSCKAIDRQKVVATGSISGTTMTFAAGSISAGKIVDGAAVTGSGVTGGTTVVQQLTGVDGGAGTYEVSISQTVAATTLTVDGRTMKYGFRNEPGTVAACRVIDGYVEGATVADYLSFPAAGITEFTTAGNIAHRGNITATGTISTNTDKALSLAGNLTTAGAYAVTFTFSGATSVTFPTSGTLVNRTGALTLQNKSLDNTNIATLKAANFALQDDTDATKQVKFIVSGVGSGNTRLMTIPDANGTIATQAYADALFASNDAMIFKGAVDCSANPNYPAADRGHTYRVSVAGKIGGASGAVVQVGDIAICNTDSTAAGDQATVGASWNVIQTNIDGAVVGPASATDGHLAQFDGTTGKLIKGGIAIGTSGGAVPLLNGANTWSGDQTFGSSANRSTLLAAAGKVTARYDNNSGNNNNIVLQNFDTTSTTDHGVNIQAQFGTSVSQTPISAGGIHIRKKQQWTATGSTQDSYMAMHTAIDGATAERMRIDGANIVLGAQAALATNATDGFAYMPTCAGTPTGTPTAFTGMVPWVYDTTNNKIYLYNGAWKATAALT